jgi:hypothetical protein
MSETYRCLYFLCVWAEPDDHAAAPPVWRYRLENVATREQRLFSQLSALVEFLRNTCKSVSGSAYRTVPYAGDARVHGMRMFDLKAKPKRVNAE